VPQQITARVKEYSAVPAKVDVEKCEGCGDCVEVCATGAISMEAEKAKVSDDDCCGCVACVDECHSQAISMQD
jgi:ferredoxin